MRIDSHSEDKILFGEKALPFNFPEDWEREILFPNPSVALDDPVKSTTEALAHPILGLPLQRTVTSGQKIAIVVSDITRLWVKPALFLPPLLQVLDRQGVRSEDVVLIVATGSHRDNSPEEIQTLVGKEVFQNYRIVNHHAKDGQGLIRLGRTSRGTEVWMNRHAAEADVVIVTGGISFHSLSGFSGGRKGILPGISGYETIQQNHRLSLREGGGVLETVKKGVLEGNPVADDMLEAARMIPNTFLFNVVMNEEGKMVQAVSGDLEKAHLEGCRTVKEMSSVFIKERRGVVLASPGGFPWDISLYQSIKTLENASYAVNEGGTILLVSECRDGVGPPDWVEWFELGKEEEIERQLRRAFTIPGFIALKTVSITRRFRVILVSRLKSEWVKKIGMIPASSIDDAIRHAKEGRGSGARSIFMPHGSFVLPIYRL